MIRLIALICFAAVCLATTSLNAADAPAIPAKENFHIYLLIGQSNMAGRGKPEKEDTTPHARVLTLTKAKEWTPAIDPIHFDKPNVIGVGPGTSFGKTLAEAKPGITVGLVPSAFGGSALDEWAKGKPHYNNAIERVKKAMESGTLKGVLWHQGEADRNKSDAYTAKFLAMLKDIRADLNAPELPIVVGTIGDWGKSDSSKINAVLKDLPKSDPKTIGCIDTAGLPANSDNVHFNTVAQREMGKRYAAEILRLVYK